MLPDILASSYKRYKEDTDVFATWLSRTAEACGYNLPRPPQPSIQVSPVASTRLKGKARKEAKKGSAGSVPVAPALHRSVTTRDMIIQATFIAKKPNAILPIKVQRVLQRAISARRRCLNWFRGVKPQADSVETETDSNATHEHFIQVLEELLEILEPCYVTAKPAPKVVDEDPAISLSNRFGMLSVEDTSNSDLDVTVTDQDLIVLPKTPSKAQPTVYELETNPDMDIPFVVYCFFEDMHRIQEFLKDTWRRYVAKELDLVTASITTNLAFALVRQAEQNVVDAYPKRFGSQNDDGSQYEKIASVIRYIYQVSYEGGAPSKGEVASAPFDDFVYMSTYHVLSKFLMLRKSEEQRGPITEVAPLGALYFWQDDLQQPTSENWEGEDERLTQLLLDLSFRKEYAPPGSQGDAIFTHFEPADDELTKGLDELIYSGDHAAISVWIVFAANCLIDIWRMADTKPAYDRLLEKAATLKESLKVKTQESVEVTSQGSLVKGPAAENMINLWRTISNVVEYNTKIHLKAEWLDKAKLQYGEGWLGQEAPTAEAAASILYPGMQAILEWDMATLERRKQKDARAIKSATHQVELESDSEDDEDLSADDDALTLVKNPDKRSSSKIIKQRKSSKKKDVEKDLAPWDQDPDTTFLLHKENGYQPPTLEDIAEIVRNKGLKLKNIRPSPDPAFFYRNNPMYCGNESLRLTIGMAYAGVNLANSYASLFAVSQLYNAAQQNHGEIVGGRWHALDEAIEANIDDLFSGQLPTTYYECWTRAVIRLGVPATAFAKNRRDAKQSSQQMVTVKGKYHLKHNQTSTILDGYLKEQESAERCLVQIGELYQTDRRAEAVRTGQQSLIRKHEKRFVTPLEALGQLREHMAESLPAMERNYVRLTKQCDTLLARIRKRRRNSVLFDDDQMGLNSKGKGATAADLQIAENKSMVFNILQEAYAASEQKKQPEKYLGLQTPNHLLMVAKEIRDFLPEANKELEPEKWEGVKGQWGNPSMSDEAAALQLFLLPFAEQRMQISGLDVPRLRIADEETPRNQDEHFEEMAEAWDFKGAIEEFNRLRSL